MRLPSTLLHNTAFLLALGLVALLAWQGQRTAVAVLASNDGVRNSLEVISAVKEARSAMQDVETGARGFVLTGQEAFLEPYDDGRAAWARAFRQLRAEVRDRQPSRDAWLREVEATAERRLRISARSIAYRRGHDLEASARYNLSLGGKRTMDQLRGLLQELENEERQRLHANSVAISHRYGEARRMLLLGSGAMLVLLLGSFVAINLNLRTRRRLELRAKEQRAFLRHVVDADPSLVYVRAPDGHLELCNTAFAEVFSATPAALEGRTPEAVGIAGQAAALFEGDRDIANGRRDAFQDEVALPDRDGRTRWFQRMKTPLLLPGGQRNALTVAMDISARREVERMKAEFVSTVSHELRTPLTAIRGSLALLVSGMAGDVDPAARPLLEIAHSSCERLVRLINDILDIEKLESGRLHLQRRPLQVRATIEQVVQQNAPYASQHGIAIEADVPADLWVNADPDRFAQIMANLLSNAAKHAPAGSVVHVDAAAGRDMATIGVRDRGAGVPAAFRERIFERFAQADSSDARQRGGTGLGLAITRSLVEQHGGRIGFEDAPGGGTRFSFTLPLAAPPAASSEPVPQAQEARPVLLLVDDDPQSAEELRGILGSTGHRPVVMEEPASALQVLRREPVRAVLVNMALQAIDPLAFVRELRSVPDFRHMPVIAIGTRPHGGQEPASGAAIGIGDWLRKPFDAGRVVAAVRACVAPGARPHVLHVEDDEDLRAMVAGLLAFEPLALHGAGSVAEARAALAARHHDLVILDLMLPDGDGADLLGQLAAARPPTRVIIFSARDSDMPESTVILRRLVKSQHGGPELAALVHAHLQHWPPGNGQGAPP